MKGSEIILQGEKIKTQGGYFNSKEANALETNLITFLNSTSAIDGNATGHKR